MRITAVRLALRTWLRYVAPLTALAAILLAPAIWTALRTGVAKDANALRAQLQSGWFVVATAWIAQLLLVGAAARLAARPTQLRAVTGGVAAIVRALAPVAVVACAVALGSLALVVPGLVLLALLATTAASAQRGEPLPAPLVDAATIARAHWKRAALVVGAIVVADVAIAVIANVVLIHAFDKRPTPAQLAAGRTFVRIVVGALVAITPLAACLLAAHHSAGDGTERA